MYKVLRPVPGTDAKVGDIVDAEEWPNLDLLVEQRYLRAVPGLASAIPIDREAALSARLDAMEARIAALESGQPKAKGASATKGATKPAPAGNA